MLSAHPKAYFSFFDNPSASVRNYSPLRPGNLAYYWVALLCYANVCVFSIVPPALHLSPVIKQTFTKKKPTLCVSTVQGRSAQPRLLTCKHQATASHAPPNPTTTHTQSEVHSFLFMPHQAAEDSIIPPPTRRGNWQ